MSIRNRARNIVQVEFDPLYDEQQEILQGARQALRSGTRAERQVARMIIRQARAARPEVKQDYRQTARGQRRAYRAVDRGMGDIPDLYRAAIMAERASGNAQSAEQRGRELSELRGRQLRARDAQVFNTRALRSEYRGTVAEVAADRAKLARQEVKAIRALIPQLRAEEQKARMEAQKFELDQQKHALDLEKHRLDVEDTRTDNRRQAREARGKGGSGGLTALQRRDAQAEIAKARQWLQKLHGTKLKSGGTLSYQQAAGLLVRGEKVGDIDLPEIDQRYVNRALKQVGMSGFFNRLGQSWR